MQRTSIILEFVEEIFKDTTEEHLRFHTDSGAMDVRLNYIKNSSNGVIWVGGVGGGMEGPAGGLYPRLAKELEKYKICSLRLDYRDPGDFEESLLDIMISIEFLKTRQITDIILVGHSFGGAIVITVGAVNENVIGVATLASQSYGTDLVEDLSPSALLVIHGEDDRILPDDASKDIYARAHYPKKLILYPHCGHVFNECQSRLDLDLTEWILDTFRNKDIIAKNKGREK